MTVSRRLKKAIDYIEDNLHSALRADDIASVACCSKYHFHRMFFSRFNMTCGEYIRRRKLTLAAVDIAHSDQKILDIALKYGYESPNAFTRAFKGFHGINPSEVRTDAVRVSSLSRVLIDTEKTGGEKMDYKIVTKPAFRILGRSKPFNFDSFVKEGQKYWKEYVASDDYQALLELSNGRAGAISTAPLLTGYFPAEEDDLCEFVDVLGLEASDEMDDGSFEAFDVPPATYAEFNCTYKTSMKTNRYIYGEWFASTGYERDGMKPDIVAYFPIPFRPMGEMCVRWWVPVNAKS